MDEERAACVGGGRPLKGGALQVLSLSHSDSMIVNSIIIGSDSMIIPLGSFGEKAGHCGDLDTFLLHPSFPKRLSKYFMRKCPR